MHRSRFASACRRTFDEKAYVSIIIERTAIVNRFGSIFPKSVESAENHDSSRKNLGKRAKDMKGYRIVTAEQKPMTRAFISGGRIIRCRKRALANCITN